MAFDRNVLIGIAVGIAVGIAAGLAAAQIIFAPIAQTEQNVSLSKTPDFESKRCIITGFAKNNLSDDALTSLDCSAKAWLDGRDVLRYRIEISGMQLIDTDGNVQDDVNQLHIHKNTMGTTEDPKGPHQLNVFRAPNFDDSDVVIQPTHGTITGVWSDADENTSYGEPDNSHTLTENLQLLCEGKIFAAAHGTIEDVPGHNAPYLKMPFDLTEYGQETCKKLGLSQ
jgi:hypothetical protein